MDARQTVGQFLQRWLEDSVRPGLRPKTYVTYEMYVRVHLIPARAALEGEPARAMHPG